MVVVVTDAQAYYYIDVLYIVASSQFADFAVPVSYSESIIMLIWQFGHSSSQNVIRFYVLVTKM